MAPRVRPTAGSWWTARAPPPRSCRARCFGLSRVVGGVAGAAGRVAPGSNEAVGYGIMRAIFRGCHSRLGGRAASLVAIAAIALLSGGTAQADTAKEGASHWLATWSASPQAATPSNLAFIPGDVSAIGFTNQTIRNVVFTSVGGSELRVRLTNSFGSQPVTFNEVDVGLVQSGATLVSGSSQTVTFAGKTIVRIAPGAEALSDPVQMAVQPLVSLAVSLFSGGATGPASYHFNANQTNYIAAGNAASSTSGAGFTTTSAAWYFVDDVDVLVRPQTRSTIVALGTRSPMASAQRQTRTTGGPTFSPNEFWPALQASLIRWSIRASAETGC